MVKKMFQLWSTSTESHTYFFRTRWKIKSEEGFDFILLYEHFLFVCLCIIADWTNLIPHLKPPLLINNLKQIYIYEVDKKLHLMEMITIRFIKKWTPYNQLVD